MKSLETSAVADRAFFFWWGTPKNKCKIKLPNSKTGVFNPRRSVGRYQPPARMITYLGPWELFFSCQENENSKA
jgi:hypothetical protein